MTQQDTGIQVEFFNFNSLPPLDASHEKIKLGGFSGLAFEGINPKTGRKSFLTHTDRGPNSEQLSTQEGFPARSFAASNFTPSLVKVELDEKELTAIITNVTPLKNSKGKVLSGLPNLSPMSKRKDSDEFALDENGKSLGFNPSGIDPEAIVHSPDGSYWMAEEYRPSILHFSKESKLITRYIPKGSYIKGMEKSSEALPSYLKDRQQNRGFEGLALQGNRLFAFLQSPIRPKDHLIPIIEFDIKTGKLVNEYSYTLEGNDADKIGDAVSIGNNKFLVIEQNSKTNDKAFRKIFEVTLEKGRPLQKKLVADLAKLGFKNVEKLEGLTILDSHTLALINDNDFSYTKPTQTSLALLHFDRDLTE